LNPWPSRVWQAATGPCPWQWLTMSQTVLDRIFSWQGLLGLQRSPIVRIPGDRSYLLVASSGLGRRLPTPAGVLLRFAGATTQAPIQGPPQTTTSPPPRASTAERSTIRPQVLILAPTPFSLASVSGVLTPHPAVRLEASSTGGGTEDPSGSRSRFLLRLISRGRPLLGRVAPAAFLLFTPVRCAV
jgi:hypothetical protein